MKVPCSQAQYSSRPLSARSYQVTQTPVSMASDPSVRDRLEVLGEVRLRPELAEDVAKLVALRRLTEIHHVRFDAFPPDHVEVLALGLDTALQLVRDVALRAGGDRRGPGKHRFELRDQLRFDLHDGHFQYHRSLLK